MPTNGVKVFLSPASIDNHLLQLSSNGFSKNTVKAYGADLRCLRSSIEEQLSLVNGSRPDTWEGWERMVSQYLNFHRRTWAPTTMNRKLGTIKGYASALGAVNFLGSYRRTRMSMAKPHPLPEGLAGVRRMQDFCLSPQHLALVGLCGLVGLRVSEAVNVRPEHFDMTNMSLTVYGKGDRVRVVPVTEEAWRSLGYAYGQALTKGTTLVQASQSAARKAITILGERAGLSGRVSSHDLRATLATSTYNRSHDIRAVQQILGHTSVVTTQVYIASTFDDMRKAMTA